MTALFRFFFIFSPIFSLSFHNRSSPFPTWAHLSFSSIELNMHWQYLHFLDDCVASGFPCFRLLELYAIHASQQ